MVDTEWWRNLQRTMAPSEALGRNVASLRRLRRLDQAAIARRLSDLGVNARQNTISRIEGASRPVSVDELVALAAVLGVEADRLHELVEDPEIRDQHRDEVLEGKIQMLEMELPIHRDVRDNLAQRVTDMEAELAELRRQQQEVRGGEHC